MDVLIGIGEGSAAADRHQAKVAEPDLGDVMGHRLDGDLKGVDERAQILRTRIKVG